MAKHTTILRLAGAMAVAAGAAGASGCSFRIQAPIREVAYDFSDRDFYDRSYAPSPTYAATPQGPGAPEERAPRESPAAACDGAAAGTR